MRFLSYIFLLISISIFVFSISSSITFQATELKELDSEFVQGLGTSKVAVPTQAAQSSVTSSSRTEDQSGDHVRIINEQYYQNYQSDTFPLTVTKYVLSDYIDINYKKETVCILVKCTNNGEKSLNDIDVYEIVPEYVSIANCSYPIKTSSVDEVLRYGRVGARILCAKDILSPEKFVKELMCNDSISCHLKKNNLTIANDDSIEENMSDELNKIIYCRCLYNQTQLLDPNCFILGEQTLKLLKLARNNKTQKDDDTLLNFLILRDSYPSYLLKPDGFLEIQENKRVYHDAGLIHIKIPEMRPRETMIFKYYVQMSNFGIQRVITQIHLSDNKYIDYQVPLDIEFAMPKFNVRVALTKLDFLPGDTICINYVVDLLSTRYISKNYIFNAMVESNSPDLSFANKKHQLIFSFSNENRTCSNSTNITINQSGEYSIPQLRIGMGQHFVIDKSIKIEELWHKYILEITLIILSLCTLFGSSIDWMRKEKVPIIIFLTISFASIVALALYLKLSFTLLAVVFFLFVPLISYYLIGLKKLN